jgi:hypothetical protein
VLEIASKGRKWVMEMGLEGAVLVHFTLDLFWSPGCKNYQKKPKTKQDTDRQGGGEASNWTTLTITLQNMEDTLDQHPLRKASASPVSHYTQRRRQNAPPGDVPKHNGP